jgi:glycosyltransferase involved in cell wall biosynthesis
MTGQFPAAGAQLRPLRVALVTSSYNYLRDGIALTLNQLVGYLERQGVEVLVFAPVADKPAFAHKGTIVEIPSIALPPRPEYRMALGLPRAARRRLDEFRPDIIHVAVPDLLGHGALRYGRSRNIPVVASYHTRYESYMQHYWFAAIRRPLAAYLRNFYATCRELYVPSPSMIEQLRAEGQQGTMRLWMRGVDTALFDPARRSADWRRRYGIAPDECVILFTGRLVREKQIGLLPDIAERLAAAGIACRMLIVGDGPDRAALEARLPNAVFAGFLVGDELAAAYASSDIFLFPSDTETFGNVTLEAMASGLPCVCADATGSRSLVEEGVTGFLVPTGDVDAYAARLALLVRDTDLRARMGEAGRARAMGFSWDGVMGRMLGYYRAVCGAPS